MFAKYSLPYDIYERHKKVGEFIKSGQTVIDVGGGLNLLSQFTRRAKITVANLKGSVEESDVVLKGDRLPFENNSYDVVSAIDVLEHIAKPDRKNFTKELLRVAKDKVILSFPVGTREHVAYEARIEKWAKFKDKEIDYLKEHLKYGLPTPNEIRKLTQNLNIRLVFSGNLKINELLFKFFIFDPKVPVVRRAVYFAKNLLNLATNPFLYAMLSNKKFSTKVVRAYLIILK